MLLEDKNMLANAEIDEVEKIVEVDHNEKIVLYVNAVVTIVEMQDLVDLETNNFEENEDSIVGENSHKEQLSTRKTEEESQIGSK